MQFDYICANLHLLKMIAYYQNRIKETEEAISILQKKDNYLSLARLLVFLLLALAMIISFTTWKWSAIIATLVLLIIFIQTVLVHLKYHTRLRDEKNRKELLLNEIACLQHRGNLYYNGTAFRDPDHDYTLDMDVFGDKGLFHYINRSATGVGNKALSQWLSAGHQLPQTLAVQETVKEIAKKQQWCEEIRVSLFDRRIKDFEKEHLPEIKKTLPAPKNSKTWIMASFGLLGITLAAIFFAGAGASLLLLPLFFNYYLNWRMGKFTKTIRMQLEGRERTLRDYQTLLSAIEDSGYQSAYFNQLRQELRLDGTTATESLGKLQGLSRKLDYSLSMITGAVLNLGFLWDIQICLQISAWFDRYALKTAQWFDAAGRLEALISLANLQNNHPRWSYPVFVKEQFAFAGKNMGHPLIPEQERVNNDFTHNGEVDIITGSNMAGKSTFLRTIGVNIILAKAGAVVCAESLTLSYFRIMTYLTITDSLTENTSTFYREIKRLKKILDSARADSNVLLLLDELLRGTNSADKAKGSMAVTRELITRKIPSIIATHNLELAQMINDFPENIRNYYFDIIIDSQNKMRFDYKLKPGICDTFNASLLLREIGIEI